MQQYKIMESLHNFDPNCLTCPSATAFFVSCPIGTAQKMSRLNFGRHLSGNVQPVASALQATSCSLPVARNFWLGKANAIQIGTLKKQIANHE